MKINMKIEDKDIKRVVPPLRFPEFRDAEGWEEESVEAVLDNQSSQIALKNIEFVQKGYPVYGADGSVGLTHDYSLSKDYISIVKDGSGVGRLMLRKRKSSILSTLNSLTSKDETTYKLNWLYYLMQTINLSSYVKGSGIPRIYYADYKKHLIYVPKQAEQTKIANCLSSLDDLISAVTDKIETLKEYKKGLMQQLFPAEGKTIPALRFTEFQNAGEWESKTLSDVCKLVRGPFGGALKKEIFVESGYAVYEQSHAIYENTSTFRYYITKDKFNELIRFAVRPNDIIMSCSGTMGKFSIIPKNYMEGVINQALLKLSTKKGNDYRFIKYVLELPSNQKQLLSDAAGGAIKNIASVSQIKEMPLLIPNLKEQQQIANCLSSVDILISSEIDKLDQLKAHRKGLMQKLFPTL